ncbi:lipopolysaccharide biosynthesis protein [Antribacter gilvus]|uniref:lipopolysaccharide biosynthesis protein n=1 Tax=Antribacter gilvus TaxID=2304675 RepID=UPI000F772094|nr:hypothetical protein [Antribacter gilvus]
MSTDQPRSVRGSATVWVAVGLAVYGLSNFVFLAVAGRGLGPAGSAPVAVAWTVLNAIGIGLFQPLEQEVGRRLAADRARNAGTSLLGALRFSAAMLGALALLGLLLHAPIADAFFARTREMVLVVVLGLLGQALAYYARGILAGSDSFARYGAQLAADGALRIVLVLALFWSGSTSRLAYGLVLVVAPVAATLLTVAVRRMWTVAVAHRAGGLSGPFAPLVAASISAQALANMGPVAVAALVAPDQQALSGTFVAAVTVARIPLFVFAALQAVILPALAAVVAERRVAEFVSTVRRATLATVALAVLGVGGVALLGQWIMHLVYGEEFTVPQLTMVLIAVSGGLFMIAQVLAQALLAHHAERVVALGWTLGFTVSLVTLLVPASPDVRVALALCTGALAAGIAHAAGLRLVMARWARPLAEEITR